MVTKERENFSSVLLALMVTLSSAVGLGNIWKVPYLTGTGGGGAFLVIYLFFVFIVALPVMVGEFTIGHRAKRNAVGAFGVLEKNPSTAWRGIGILGVLVTYIILFFYSSVAGWVFSYAFKALTGGLASVSSAADAEAIFAATTGAGTTGMPFFSQAVLTPVFWQIVALTFVGGAISLGVSKGIEKVIQFMMPGLFVLLLICAARALTLPNSVKGLHFLFHIDFSQVTPEVVLTALGLAFFKLSLGMGIMITYGSYFTDDSDLTTAPAKIAIVDIVVSMLAGLAIFPAVFSFGLEPQAGPGLLFMTIPLVFSQMPFGNILLFGFFLLTVFAASGALMSLLEVPTAWIIEEFGMERRKATIINIIIIALFGILASTSVDSTSYLGNVKICGKGFFDLFDSVTSNIMMPIGGILIALYVGYRMKSEDMYDELTNHGTLNNKLRVTLIRFLCRYVAPILIVLIMMNSLGFLTF